MPLHPPILAANDAGALIWLIIMIFWAISTVAQKLREKKEAERRRALRPAGPSGAPPPPPPLPESRKPVDPEEELRRFLQELTGMGPAHSKPEPAEPPPLPPEPPRPPPVRHHKRRPAPEPPPLIQFDEPTPAPVRVEQPGAYANLTQEIGAADDQHIYQTLDEIEDIEVLMSRQAAHLYSGETMVRQDSMLVNLSKIRVPLMTLPFVSYKSVCHPANRPPLTSDRHALRQSLIARVVLGPCKALDATPGKDGMPSS